MSLNPTKGFQIMQQMWLSHKNDNKKHCWVRRYLPGFYPQNWIPATVCKYQHTRLRLFWV